MSTQPAKTLEQLAAEHDAAVTAHAAASLRAAQAWMRARDADSQLAAAVTARDAAAAALEGAQQT